MKGRYGDMHTARHPLRGTKRTDLAMRLARTGIPRRVNLVARIDGLLGEISRHIGGEPPANRWNRRCFMAGWCDGPFMYVDIDTGWSGGLSYDPSNPFPADVGVNMGGSKYHTKVVRDFRELEDAAIGLLGEWMSLNAGGPGASGSGGCSG